MNDRKDIEPRVYVLRYMVYNSSYMIYIRPGNTSTIWWLNMIESNLENYTPIIVLFRHTAVHLGPSYSVSHFRNDHRYMSEDIFFA